MITKNQMVRDYVESGEYKKALGICKDWDKGISVVDRDTLRTSYECMVHTRFYKELGFNTDYIIMEGIRILIKYYGRSNSNGRS